MLRALARVELRGACLKPHRPRGVPELPGAVGRHQVREPDPAPARLSAIRRAVLAHRIAKGAGQS